MKTKISPTVIGAFVIGAFALLVVALLTFGGINFFDKPQRFIVYVDESVHGLDLGSPVKLRGVRVGRVVALNIRYNEKTNKSVVAVVCELSKDVMTDPTGAVIDVASRAELQNLVDRGLRAKLDILGLATGLLFVQLDFVDVKENPVDASSMGDTRYVVVPWVQSTIAGYYEAASEILADLKQVDFAALSRGLMALVADSRRQLNGLDLKGLTEQWKKTGAQYEALATGPEVKQLFENLNALTGELRAAIAKLDQQIEPAGKELTATLVEVRNTLEGFNKTAASAQDFIARNGGIGGEVADTLQRLSLAAESVKRLADFLERNPNALLTGRARAKRAP